MDLSFLQPRQGQLARCRGRHHLHTADPLDHIRKQACGGIATRKKKLLEKQKATLEAKLPTYTPEQRAAKIKDYEKKVDELRKMLQKADKEMKPMQEELIREVYGKIEKASRDFGGANGFSVILEKRELLYLGSGVDAQDVTEQIIAELNKK